MKVALGLPSTIPGATRQQVLDFAQIAEQGGLDSVWVIDRIAYPNLDPMAALLAAAAVTEHIRLGTSILLEPLRNPVLVAKQAASLDVLSGGRLILGMAAGGREDDFRAVGASFHDRGRRFERDINTIRRVWEGYAPAKGVRPVGPTPVQQPIPIWLGGGTERTIRRAARLGDGYIVGGGGPGRAGQAILRFRDFWQEEGRDGDPPTAALAYFSVADNAERAYQQARTYLHDYYSFALGQFDPVQTALLGTPEEVVAQANDYVAAGVDLLIFFPCSPSPSQAEAVAGPIRERLAPGD